MKELRLIAMRVKARRQGKHQERARIVQWIREELCCNCDSIDHPKEISDAIERGDHEKGVCEKDESEVSVIREAVSKL